MEYDLPLEGLTLTSGLYYTGSSYGNDLNTNKLGYYATMDFGARYIMDIKELISLKFILNVANITDERYWGSQAIGSPRTYAFSVTATY